MSRYRITATSHLIHLIRHQRGIIKKRIGVEFDAWCESNLTEKYFRKDFFITVTKGILVECL